MTTPALTSHHDPAQLRDPDGDALTYAVTMPAKGVLRARQQPAGTVTYGPLPGFIGTDTFTYTASAYGVTSAPATATVTVVTTPTRGPQVSPTPTPTATPGPSKPVTVPITVAFNWSASARATRHAPSCSRSRTSRTARRSPSRARRAKSCPFKGTKTIKVKKGEAPLLSLLAKKKLKPGVKVTITVTKFGFIGRVVTFTTQKNALPKRADLCIQPFQTKPSACLPGQRVGT